MDELLTRGDGAGPVDELLLESESLLDTKHQLRQQGGSWRTFWCIRAVTCFQCLATSGCAWRHLPATFGVSPATAHRRFTAWTGVGLWRRLHRAVLDELGARGKLGWTSAIIDAASVRAKRGVC